MVGERRFRAADGVVTERVAQASSPVPGRVCLDVGGGVTGRCTGADTLAVGLADTRAAYRLECGRAGGPAHPAERSAGPGV